MATTYIVHHNENIRDIEGKSQSANAKSKIQYTSQHKQAIRGLYKKTSTVKLDKGMQLLFDIPFAACKTMGKARKTDWPIPSQFLRKNEGVKFRKVSDHVCPEKPKKEEPGKTKSSTSTKKEPPKPTQKPKKDFIKDNITNVKNFKREHPPRYIDTGDGRSRLMLPSGLLPTHLCLKSFGKTPCYVKFHKQKLQHDQKECVETKKRVEVTCNEILMDGIRKVGVEEVLCLINGLKSSHERIMKEYVSLPILADTDPMKIRKSALERQLTEIEADMNLLEDDHHFYVALYD